MLMDDPATVAERIVAEYASVYGPTIEERSLLSELIKNAVVQTLHAQIQKFQPQDGDVLVLKTNDPYWEHEQVQSILKMFYDQGIKGLLFLFARPDSDLACLNEQDMAELGWIRAEPTSRELVN